jgi:hypothetical protein
LKVDPDGRVPVAANVSLLVSPLAHASSSASILTEPSPSSPVNLNQPKNPLFCFRFRLVDLVAFARTLLFAFEILMTGI